ncbi:MAG TPA: hypothetical protein VFZ31_13515 [Vicinamibacterales bacterium]
MSDWLVLGLFAIAFYLFECCTWTPATVFACYRKPLRIRWAAAPGSELPGNESGGLALSDPLTLSGSIMHAAHWPIAVSPEGVCADHPDADQFWPFAAIESIRAHDNTVRINGEIACRTASEALATGLARDLESLRQLPAGERAKAIRSLLRESFDAEVLESTWSRFKQSSRRLALVAKLPLMWLLVVTPIAIVALGPLRAWPYLLGGLFLSALIVSIHYIRVHRRELPDGADRWLHAVSMTLFPIAAIRAVDRISKERISRFNPLAVAAVFCGHADADALLRRGGFDLERTDTLASEPAAARCQEWYRAQKRAAFNESLRALKRNPFTAPERIDDAVSLYCPRCHSQFEDGVSECADCGDVALIPLPGAAVEEPRSRERKRA